MQDDPRLRALRARIGAGSGVAKPSDPRLDALRARTGGQTSTERIQGTELPTVGEGFVPPATPEAPYSPPPGPGVEAIHDLFNAPGYKQSAAQTAARGLLRGAVAQGVEGAGQTLQALPAHLERVAGRGDFRADQPQSRTEALLQGGKDLLAGPGRVAGDASRMIGGMVEQAGASYGARFPAEDRLSRPTQGPTGPMKGEFPGEEPFQPFGEGAPRSRLGGGVDMSNPNWWINVAAESIGQIGSQLALATLTGGMGPVVQFMAFAGPTLAIEAGGAYRENFERFEKEFRAENRREPTEAELEEMDQRAAGVAMIRGAGAMALDKLPYGAIIRRRSPQTEQLFLRRFAERMAQEPNIGGILIKGAGSEAFTEAAQEVWGAVVQDLWADDPEAWEGIAGRMFTGAVGGAAGGGFAGATQIPAERAQARAWRDMLGGLDGDTGGAEFAAPDSEATAEEAPGAPQEPAGTATAPTPRPEPVAQAEPPAAAAPAASPAQTPKVMQVKARVDALRRRVAEAVDPSIRAELRGAYQDPLTGLANAKAWEVARPRAEADPDQRIVFADISNFKALNDNLGMDAGDKYLREVAYAARQAAKVAGIPERNLFRPKGDEYFAVGTEAEAQQFAEEFQRQMPQRQIGEFTVTGRVGVGRTFEEADKAQAAAKKAEKGPRARDLQVPSPVSEQMPGELKVAPPEAGGPAPVQDVLPPSPVSGQMPGELKVAPDFEADLDIDPAMIPEDLDLEEAPPPPSREERLAAPKKRPTPQLTGDGIRIPDAQTTIEEAERDAGTMKTEAQWERYARGLGTTFGKDWSDEDRARFEKLESATIGRMATEGATRTAGRSTAIRDQAWREMERATTAAEVDAVLNDIDRMDAMDMKDRAIIQEEGINRKAAIRSGVTFTKADIVPTRAGVRAVPHGKPEADRAEDRRALGAKLLAQRGEATFLPGDKSRDLISWGEIMERYASSPETPTLKQVSKEGEIALRVGEELVAIVSTQQEALEMKADILAAQRDFKDAPLQTPAAAAAAPRPTRDQLLRVGKKEPGTEVGPLPRTPKELAELTTAGVFMEGVVLLEEKKFEEFDRWAQGFKGAPMPLQDVVAALVRDRNEMVQDAPVVEAEPGTGEKPAVKAELGSFTEDLRKMNEGNSEDSEDAPRGSSDKSDISEAPRTTQTYEELMAERERVAKAEADALRRVHLPAGVWGELREFLGGALGVQKFTEEDVTRTDTVIVASEGEWGRAMGLLLVAQEKDAPVTMGPGWTRRRIATLEKKVEKAYYAGNTFLPPAQAEGGRPPASPPAGDRTLGTERRLHAVRIPLTAKQYEQIARVVGMDGGTYPDVRFEEGVLYATPNELDLLIDDLEQRGASDSDFIRIEGVPPARIRELGRMLLKKRGEATPAPRVNLAAPPVDAVTGEMEAASSPPQQEVTREDDAPVEAEAPAGDRAEPVVPQGVAPDAAAGGGVVPGVDRAAGGGDVPAAVEVDPGDVARQGDAAVEEEGRDGGGVVRDEGDDPDTTPRRWAGPRVDFQLPQGELELGGPKARARNNIAAIRLVQELHATGAQADAEQQAVLSKFVGWGGISKVFANYPADFMKESEELLALLTKEEWEAARKNTLNAHYTSLEVVRSIWAGVNAMGIANLDRPRVLEPSVGIGHFIGARSNPAITVVGVELDPWTARIATQLYPNHPIRQADFARIGIPDGSVDVAIGNVPFGQTAPYDRRYRGIKGLTLHDYFFVKAMDKLRPGGVMAFITSMGTMDKKGTQVREYLADQADMVAAYRLPNTAFKEAAATEVTTDLIILRKRLPGESPAGPAWTKVVDYEAPIDGRMKVNEYFAMMPGNMLGIMGMRGTMYRADTPALQPDPKRDWQQELRAAMEALPADTLKPGVRAVQVSSAVATASPSLIGATAMEGKYVVAPSGKTVLRIVNGKAVTQVPSKTDPTKQRPVVPSTQQDKVRLLVGLRDQHLAVLETQLGEGLSPQKQAAERAKLSQLHDAFVKKYGPINKEEIVPATEKTEARVKYPNLDPFKADPQAAFVAALERWDPQERQWAKADVQTKRVLEAVSRPETADNVTDALAVALAESATLNVARVAALTSKSEAEALKELKGEGLIFEDPVSGELVLRHLYLSGDVVQKLREAEDALAVHGMDQKLQPTASDFSRNVDQLKAIQPVRLTQEQVHMALGAPWIPWEYVQAFLAHLGASRAQAQNTKGTFVAGKWVMEGLSDLNKDASFEATWTVERQPAPGGEFSSRVPFSKIFAAAITGGGITSSYPVWIDGKDEPKRVKHPKATMMAKDKVRQLQGMFTDFVASEARFSEPLLDIYNNTFNNLVAGQFDGSHLTFPGMAEGWAEKLFPWQRNAIWRILTTGNTLLAHLVGAGKTNTMIASGMEGRRMGLFKKPSFVVPNHLVVQFSNEFLQLYPNARILTGNDISAKEDRAEFQVRIASGDWDGVIMAHSTFQMMKPSPALERKVVEMELQELQQLLDVMEAENKAAGIKKPPPTVKVVEAKKAALEAKLDRLLDIRAKDDTIYFDQLGIDQLFVDESHTYKNLFINTSLPNMAKEGSGRAVDLYAKAQWYNQTKPGWGMVFASGTPVSNSFGEMYTIQRYLQPQVLADAGIKHFDAWVKAYAHIISAAEYNVDGTFKVKDRYSKFMNVGDLVAQFRQVADVVFLEDMEAIMAERGMKVNRPTLRGGKAQVIVSPRSDLTTQFLASLKARADAIRAGEVDRTEDNYLKISSDGRKAALDFRMMFPDARPENPKIEAVADNIHHIWQEQAEKRLTQLAFIDFSSPSAEWAKKPKKKKKDEDDDGDLYDFGAEEGSRFSAYDELRRLLLERGIPDSEIAFMHDYTTDAAKAVVFAAVRAGRIRILIGSRERMGAGTNVQTLGIAIHQVDPPWRPSDMAQALGRFLRTGNLNPEIDEFIYVSEGTYDAMMYDGLRRKESMATTLIRSGRETRIVEDVDVMVLNYAMLAAVATGDPNMLRLLDVQQKVMDLERGEQSHLDTMRRAEEQLASEQGKVKWLEQAIVNTKIDAKIPPPPMPMRVEFRKKTYDLDELGPVLEAYLRELHNSKGASDVILGSVGAFRLGFRHTDGGVWGNTTIMYLQGKTEATYGTQWTVGADIVAGGIPTRLVNLTTKPSKDLQEYESRLNIAARNVATHTSTLAKDDGKFNLQAELDAARAEESALNTTLGLDETDEGNIDTGEGDGDSDGDEDGPTPRKKKPGPMGTGGFLVNPFSRPRKPPPPPLFRSNFEGVEERIAAARGIRNQPLFERVKKAAADVRATMTRRQPLLDTRDATMAASNDLLRFEEGSADWARAVAYHEIGNVVKDLDPAELELFTLALFLPDMVKDIEAGRYGDVSEAAIAARKGPPGDAPAPAKALPYGYPSEEAVRADLERVEELVGKHSRVAEAVARRREFAGNLTRRLVDNELLPAEVLEDERYYHRQVMEYFHMQDFGGTGTSARDLRLHEKGFQKGRTGGGDFNTAFEQAEFEWVSQALVLLARKEALERIEELANIQSQLKREAKAANLAAIAAMYKVSEGGKDPLAIYRGRIGMALAELAKLAGEGDLDVSLSMIEVVRELREELERHRDEVADGNDAPFQFSHPQFFALLADLLNTGGAGARSAGVIFKAIREREAFVKEKLGPQYRTWRKIIPDGYRIWQPKKGAHFFMGLTVEERVLERAREEDRALTTEEVKSAMIRGGRRQEWVIPEELAATLDKMKPDMEVNALEDAWTEVQQTWKQWVLLNPVRFLRYNLNNMSGDMDIAFAFDPAIVTRYGVQAAKDLHAHMKGRATKELSDEILAATKLQVMGGLRLAEIQDISQAGLFSRFDRENASAPMQAVDKYWKSVRDFTDWRENILRLAAYRYFTDRLNAAPGVKVYGASKRYEIDAIERTDEKAAKLARELIGDYGDISRGGQWLRRRLLPFYSWIEINAPRYARLLANAPYEEGVKGRGGRLAMVGAKKGAGAVVSLTVRAHILYILTALWNKIFFGDEDEELRGQHKGHHLILGRRDDGTIVSLRFEGALSDALSWFGLADWLKDAADLAKGDKDLADMAHEAAKAPVERIINSLEPVTKTTFELAMGQRTYPNIFESGSSWRRRNQPIRDPVEHALGAVSLNRLYSRVSGKPQRQDQFLTPFNLPGAALGGAAGGMMLGVPGAVAGALLGTMLMYQTDPGEAAYWDTRGRVYRYLEEQDVASGGAAPTARANALYYFRRAAAWGDEKAQDKWLQEYYRLGGRPANLQQSLQRAAPLAVLPAKHRRAFLLTLSAEDTQVLEMAQRWYQATIANPADPGRAR